MTTTPDTSIVPTTRRDLAVAELRRLAEVARLHSADLDLQAGAARIGGDAATSDDLAARSSYAWGVSQTLTWLAGGETGPWLAQALAE